MESDGFSVALGNLKKKKVLKIFLELETLMSVRSHICKSCYFLQKAVMYFYDRLRSLSQEQISWKCYLSHQ